MYKIITIAEIQHLPEQSLWELLGEAHKQLIRSDPGSANRRNALASLETISSAMGQLDPL